jgi:hypothetical protein
MSEELAAELGFDFSNDDFGGTYVPSEESIKFIAFIRLTGNESNSSPVAHYKIGDALFSKNEVDWYTLIECLRGMGKSTLIEYAVIYVASLGYWPNFGPVPFIVFLGASQDGNVKQFFKNVASKIENSPFLRQLLTVPRCVDNEIEMINNRGVELIVTGRGMNTNWRGVRSKRGARPSILIADDILGNDVMTSQTIRETVETNWFNSALPALDPIKHKVFYIGTPLSDQDLLAKLKNSGSYNVIRFPLCPKFPVDEADFVSIWPERFTYTYTLKMYNQFISTGKSRSFYTEYMLELTDLTALIVEPDMIKWFDLSLFTKNKKEAYNYYIVTDWATSVKKKADWSCIAVFAIASNGAWFLVDGQAKRQTMQDNLEDIFYYVRKWKPLSVGMETSGQQGGFLSIINTMMMEKNLWFQLAKKRGSKEFGIRPVKDKLHRFVTGVAPMFEQGKVWLPQPDPIKLINPNLYTLVQEMDDEISKLTMTGGVEALSHDDAIDLLNQLSEMETYAPSEDQAADIRTPDGIPAAPNNPWGDEDSYESSGSNVVF